MSHHERAMAVGTQETKKRKGPRPRCEDCFFHQNMLCALGLKDGCPTFQLSFVFRQERRTQAIEFQPQYP
jgi:hypothetical protein